MGTPVSTMTILLDINRMFKFADNSWMNSAVQAIGNAIQGIGCSAPTTKKIKTVIVSNMRATIPKDCLSIKGLSYKGNRIPVMLGTYSEDEKDLGYGYRMNTGYIKCPFIEGTLELHYSAIPVDDKNLPLIYNDFDYKEAVRWRIIMELLMSGYEHKVFNFRDAEDRWENFRGRAANSVKMPSRDEMDAFGRRWINLFSDDSYINNFDRGIDTIADKSGLEDYIDRNRLANNN